MSWGKVAVVGAIARKGKVVAQVIDNVAQETLEKFLHRTVDERVSLVATDEADAYLHIKRPHGTVNHRRREYVRGNIHTANIDSFWSLLKRGVMGTFHNVSKAYLPFYLAEFSFRHNNRNHEDMFAAVVAAC